MQPEGASRHLGDEQPRMRTYLSQAVAYLVECGASQPSTAQGTRHQMWPDQDQRLPPPPRQFKASSSHSPRSKRLQRASSDRQMTYAYAYA